MIYPERWKKRYCYAIFCLKKRKWDGIVLETCIKSPSICCYVCPTKCKTSCSSSESKAKRCSDRINATEYLSRILRGEEE